MRRRIDPHGQRALLAIAVGRIVIGVGAVALARAARHPELRRASVGGRLPAAATAIVAAWARRRLR